MRPKGLRRYHLAVSHRQRLSGLLLISLICFGATSISQSRNPGASASTAVTVPFIGCKSDGQVGPLDAPTGQAPAITLPSAAAKRLAYYKAENGIGVLAPRGWHCFSTYGSSGSNLFVNPQALDATNLFSTDWKGFAGPAIQLSVADGGTSGRFQVAKVIARLFPDRRQFVQDVVAEGIEPATSFPIGPYPQDKLTYRSKSIVEFETPANAEGLGTASRLQANSIPIRGVAILLSDDNTSLIQLSARPPDQDRDLTAAILQQVEREAIADQGR
jgi:hypothetical protein